MARVTIYTTLTCGFCGMAKAFFRKHNIAYEEKDVSRDHAAAEEMVEKSQQLGVPVVDIDGEMVVGFDEPRLRALLLGITRGAVPGDT